MIRDAEGWETVCAIFQRKYFLFRLEGPSDGVLEEGHVAVDRTYLLVARPEVSVEGEGLEEEQVSLSDWRAYFVPSGQVATLRIDSQRIEHGGSRPRLSFAGAPVEGLAGQYRAYSDVWQIRWDSGSGEAVEEIVIRLERGASRFSRSWKVSGSEAAIPDDIREALRGIGVGRFAVRCYDAKQELVTSDDFRLVTGLKRVTKTNLDDGSVRVEFELEPEPELELERDRGYHIELAGLDATVENTGENTDRPSYLIGPNCCAAGAPESPRFHRLSYLIRPNQRQARPDWWDLCEWIVSRDTGDAVKIGVDLERLAWAIGEDESCPPAAHWGCQPLDLRRADFVSTSQKRLWFWIPQSRRMGRPTVLLVPQGTTLSSGTARELKVDNRGLATVPLRELGHLLPEGVGIYELLLRISADRITVGLVTIVYECSLCGKSDVNEDNMLRHLCSGHTDTIFRVLSEGEILAQSGGVLPDRLYICPYCGKYFPESGKENGNTAISRHQQNECPKAREKVGNGPVQVSIRILDRCNEQERSEMIRRLYGRRRQCSVCGSDVPIENCYRHLKECQWARRCWLKLA
ncbi:MAG: hypothetical protein RMK01_10040 [Thermomicrobium sp.]|nr:hypothetical protein [Thermomicrobium sp.]